jgi:hypothetical protein
MKNTFARVALLTAFALTNLSAVTIGGVSVTGPSNTIGIVDLDTAAISNAFGEGAKFFGSGSADCSNETTCVLQFDFTIANSLSTSTLVDFVMSITSFAGPIAWEFTDGSSTIYASGSTSGSGAQPVTGGFSAPDGLIRFTASSSETGDGFFVTIPPSSLDFLPAEPTTVVPEPATMALTAAALVFGGLLGRRKLN